jgi:very-short-patch-repair endonuclease
LDEKIAALAKRQRGYVKRQQLMKLGLGAEAIRYRVKIGRLIPVYAGVYAVGHLPTLPQDRAAGALLASGPHAVLSHGSAASAWGIFKRWELPFEVTVKSVRRRRGIHVHRAALERRDIRTHLGLRVTSPARMLLDIAPRLSDRALQRAANDLRRPPGLMRIYHLSDVLSRFPRNPSSHRLRPLLDAPPGGPTRSQMEDDFLAFAERFGFPRPQVNVKVAGREADIWFPRERVIVEIDSWEYHRDRTSFESDRDNDATALAIGIVTVRITWERLIQSPEREAERLWAILRARRFLAFSQSRVPS